MGKKKTKIDKLENREMHQAMLGFRFSNATTRHVVKSRKGTRGSRAGRAIKDSMSA